MSNKSWEKFKSDKELLLGSKVSLEELEYQYCQEIFNKLTEDALEHRLQELKRNGQTDLEIAKTVVEEFISPQEIIFFASNVGVETSKKINSFIEKQRIKVIERLEKVNYFDILAEINSKYTEKVQKELELYYSSIPKILEPKVKDEKYIEENISTSKKLVFSENTKAEKGEKKLGDSEDSNKDKPKV